MKILLPPSEAKRDGGTGDRLNLRELSFPSLTPTRRALVRSLIAVAKHPGDARRALGLSESQDDEIRRNAKIRTSPTTSALDRYSGVLFDALDASTLPPAGRRSLWIASALFGLLAADDPVPAYRLSAASRLPGLGTLASIWKPSLGKLLLESGPLLDLRSGSYVALAPIPGAFVARVVDGDGRFISHHNKATKGRLARALCGLELAGLDDIVDATTSAGMRVRVTGQRTFDVVI